MELKFEYEYNLSNLLYQIIATLYTCIERINNMSAGVILSQCLTR